MKKVLILGGSGFIGINIAKTLVLDKEYNVTIADINCSKRIDDYFSSVADLTNLNVIEGDFTTPEAYDLLEKNYDEVYMMAAIVGVNNTLERPEEVIRVNTPLTYFTLEWLRESNVKKVLFASSSECYVGATDVFDYKIPTPETVPLCVEDITHPRFTYAITKMHGESAFLNCAKTMGYNCTIVRYHNIFGPDMGFNHVIPHLVQRFKNQETPFKIYGYDQTRAFCYISDGVDGTIRAMESTRSNGEVYHIGNTAEITISELTQAVGGMMGYKGEYENAPTYPGSVSRRCPDISKAQYHLNYAPSINWKDGVQRAVTWYEEFFDSGKEMNSKGFEPPEKFEK